jgi:hypothetical protein
MDSILLEQPPSEIADVIELLGVCMKTICFHFQEIRYHQEHVMAMGSSSSPVLSNIFMVHFEEVRLNTTDFKPAIWPRYDEDTFVVWPHGPTILK